MLNPTRTHKSFLTITLTEPLVVLRTVNVARFQSQPEAMSPPSMLRGLLTLDLAKASKISSIDVELQVVSASWSEGTGTQEEHMIYNVTQAFFRAASSHSTRRCMSVDPASSLSANHPSPPPASPPETEPALQTPAPVDLLNDACQRGRLRVRRRSSADHLVFQRDPVEHLTHPPAPSPLSFPPAVEEEVEMHTPGSSHVLQLPNNSTSIPLSETPTPSYTEAHSVLEDPHVANIGETETLSRLSSASGAASTAPDGPTVKGHRSQTSRNFCSIFGRGLSHTDSPPHDEGRPESPSAGGKEHVQEKCEKKRHGFFSHRKGEALALEEEHKEFGDGWREFRKGAYTFPISFEIPSYLPPSLKCDNGAVIWRLVAKVRRPGVFTSKLIATREVQVISIPAETGVETTDVQIEGIRDDRLHYLLETSKKVFAIGGSFHVKMSLMPLAKVQVHRLAINLEERVDNFAEALNVTRISTNVIQLLNLQHDDHTKPLLPLDSDDPLAYEKSPLCALRPGGASPSEEASQLLGHGPWYIRAKLRLPADCNVLHPTNMCKDSTVRVTHRLCFIIHLSQGDDSRVDSKPAKRRLVEVVRLPVHVLSCYARTEFTALPRYSETLDQNAIIIPHACPCAAEGRRRALRTHSSEASPTRLAEASNVLFERTLAYERLVSGHEDVLGDAPPAYEPRSSVSIA